MEASLNFFLLASLFLAFGYFMYQHYLTEAYKELIILAMLAAIKYLQSHMYDINYSNCKHTFLFYIMLGNSFSKHTQQRKKDK